MQGEDSFLREAKERLQCLSSSPALLPEAPSLFLFTSSCSLSLSVPPSPLLFSLLSQALMLYPLHAHSHTPHPSSVTVPKTWQRKRQEQSFIFWPHPTREQHQSVLHSPILPRAHTNQALPDNTHTHIHTHNAHAHSDAHTTWCVVNIPVLRSLLHLR